MNLSFLLLVLFYGLKSSRRWIDLQNEDKEVHGFVSLEEVVLRSVFVLGVELEVLHNTGMFDKMQQDLLRQVAQPERLHFCRINVHTHTHAN